MNWLFLVLLATQAFFIPQTRLNDCGTASMLMVARHYDRGMETGSRELQDRVTGGEDRALHFTELVYYLEEWYGVETEITYNPDVFRQENNRNNPVIVLVRDKVHWVVVYKYKIYDPKEGVMDLSKGSGLRIWLNQHDWVAFRITEVK